MGHLHGGANTAPQLNRNFIAVIFKTSLSNNLPPKGALSFEEATYPPNPQPGIWSEGKAFNVPSQNYSMTGDGGDGGGGGRE